MIRRLVPRCQVRHLGALGTAGGTRPGRLVRPLHVYAGHPHYDHHVKTYGHPSEKGYKDIIPLWTADKFDPEALVARYRAAGARYIVSMGVHHDNFDLWRSGIIAGMPR